MPAASTPNPMDLRIAMTSHGITLRTLAESAEVNYSTASLVLGGKRKGPKALAKLNAQLERLIKAKNRKGARK